MRLSEYVKEYGIPPAKMAEDLGISINYFYEVRSGIKRPSLDLTVDIEKLTKNKVTAQDLFAAWLERQQQQKAAQ